MGVTAALAIRQACHAGRGHAARGGLWVSPLRHRPASAGPSSPRRLPFPCLSFPESPGRPGHPGGVTQGRCPRLSKYTACQPLGLLPSGRWGGEHEETARGQAR